MLPTLQAQSTLCLKKTAPMLHVQITPTNLNLINNF